LTKAEYNPRTLICPGIFVSGEFVAGVGNNSMIQLYFHLQISIMKKLIDCFPLFMVMIFFCCANTTIHAQDNRSEHAFKYAILYAAADNGQAPGFSNFRYDLEAGLKKQLAKSNITVLKNQKDAGEKGINECDILSCTYTIAYSPGMMLNANITCSINIADCHKKEIFSADGKKMVGAVAGSESYLKLFERIMKGDIIGGRH
jgi:hypothetical protein